MEIILSYFIFIQNEKVYGGFLFERKNANNDTFDCLPVFAFV